MVLSSLIHPEVEGPAMFVLCGGSRVLGFFWA